MDTKEQLVHERLYLGDQIVHYRKMIKRDYHPEFFEKLVKRTQTRQAEIIKKERQMGKENK